VDFGAFTKKATTPGRMYMQPNTRHGLSVRSPTNSTSKSMKSGLRKSVAQAGQEIMAKPLNMYM